MKKIRGKWDRMGALALAVILAWTTVDMPVVATGNQDVSCEHHVEHTAECGYAEGEDGLEVSPCIFECEECANASNDGSDTVSGNEVSDETTECTCETEDPAFHATNCPAYIAPENPQCTCAEKCTEDTLNVWCDVCGMQGVSACQGEDTAVVYTDVVASITNGETVTNYATFDEALANWTDGTTLTLLTDVTLTERIKTYAKGLSLDLNGHKIECSDTLCTIWIDGASGSELTIRDSQDGGHINGKVYAVAGGSKLCLESGTVETVVANGDFTMTGGRIFSEDVAGLNVNYEVDVVISGGEIYGSEYGVRISLGNVIISGDTKITGAGQYAIWSSSSAEVVISGTPTISGGAGELFLGSKITLNTQPADGKVWRVKINTEEITDGIFEVPGEDIALDASKFASAMDGYEVKQNAKGELLLCNHTEQTAASNGDGTHNTTCNCGETTFDTNVDCSGGVATDTHQAYCEYCNAPYGELNPDVHYDIIALTMTTEELEDALLELLNSGETDISILLAENVDKEMFTAINTALRSSTAVEGSVNLTIAGVQVVTNGALGNGDPDPELNTDPVALKTLNFPDAVTLELGALTLPNVQAVYLPKVTEWEIWGIDADNISTLVLTAPGTITADFDDLSTYDIDLTLHCNKINDVTDGTTWQGVTWKSISFDHKDSAHTTATNNGNGTHSFTCTVCNSVGAIQECTDEYSVVENKITKKCTACGEKGYIIITAEGGIYDGTTAYGATVEKTGIFENEEVTVYYYQGDTLIGTDAPVDAGTYTAKITYKGVTASVTYMISTTPTADMFTYIESAVYDGTEKSANVVVKDGITGIGAITNIKYYQNDIEVTPINAGTYTVKIDVADGDIYDAATDIEVGTFEITKATPTSDMFTATPSSELVYDGTEKSIIVTTDKEGMGTFTVSYNPLQPVDAGYYIIRLHIEEGDNYNAVDTLSFGWFEIKKADSVISADPTPADLVYDGTAHNLINAGTATGGEMQYSLDGTNYSSAIPTGTDAKTYTVWYKVDGDDNHNDTEPASIEVTIAPKTVEIISVTASDRVFDGTNTVEISEVIIEGILVEDEDKVSVSATAAIDSINAGVYSKVDLSNIALTGSANYSIAASAEDVQLTTSVTISKADAPTLPSGSKAYVYSIGYEGESVSITGLPTDCGEVEYSLLSVSSDMFENVSVDANGKTTYDIKELDSYTEDLQGIISVNVMMENYKTAIYTLTITRTEKIPQNISAEDITLTYGDADATISVTGAKTELSYEVVEDSNDNGYVVTVDANGKVSIENAGTAIIKITAVESDDYAESECEIRVTVNKRPVNIKAESYTVKKGDTLPTFYYDVTGLVNNETLPITVSIACTASDTNTVGTYDITVSGVSSEGNYTYVYTNGVLEVLAEDEAPFIMGDDGKMGWDAISDEIEDANKGDTIVVDMNGATVVSGDIIEEARDKGITISFVLDNGLIWTIDGSTVTDGDISNINFDTTVEDENNPLNNIPVDVINGVTGEKATIEVNLTYSGNFGFTAVLKANLGSDNAGYYANLYYYNPTTGKLEYMCADVIASNGEAELAFTHASDYLVVIDDVDLGKDEVPDSGKDEVIDSDKSEVSNIGSHVVPNTGSRTMPNTGDAGTIHLWIMLLGSLLGMAGVAGYAKMAKKKE